MPEYIVFNPIDDHTCEFCAAYVGKPEWELEPGEPPFDECEAKDGDCRCYLAIERAG